MCPGRGAAFFTLLRRAGTYSLPNKMDPGSAARREERCAASGARSNPHRLCEDSLLPLAALRDARGGGLAWWPSEVAAQIRAQIHDCRRVAIERVGRIALVAQGLEPHRARVHH